MKYLIFNTMHNDHPAGWFSLGSVVGSLYYWYSNGFKFKVTSVTLLNINWWDVYSHVMEAVIVAVFAGAGTYLGKEIMRWAIRKIRARFPKQK